MFRTPGMWCHAGRVSTSMGHRDVGYDPETGTATLDSVTGQSLPAAQQPGRNGPVSGAADKQVAREACLNVCPEYIRNQTVLGCKAAQDESVLDLRRYSAEIWIQMELSLVAGAGTQM